jgi:uncharacterized membrane protein YeaQ/YmgE (transglycosylase-associated protein family)
MVRLTAYAWYPSFPGTVRGVRKPRQGKGIGTRIEEVRGMRHLRHVIALSALPLVAAQGKGDRVDVDVGSIILYALIGLVVGLLARFLVPGRDPLGFFGTLILGVVGALIGGWLAGAVLPETEGVDWLASLLVAIVLVLLVRMFRGGTWGRRTY